MVAKASGVHNVMVAVEPAIMVQQKNIRKNTTKAGIGRLPLYQVVESFRPAMARAYKLAQANKAYSRFSFFISPRYTVFL